MNKIVFFITGIFAMLIMASTCETTTQNESGTVYLDSAQHAQINAKIDGSLTLVKNFQSDAWDSINLTLKLFSDVISAQGMYMLKQNDSIVALYNMVIALENRIYQLENPEPEIFAWDSTGLSYPDFLNFVSREGYILRFEKDEK